MSAPAPLRGRIARQAYPASGALAAGAALAAALGATTVAAGALGLALANLAFFRNPRRAPPPGEHRVLASGDGRVVEVARLEEPDEFVGPGWRIAVFLSIFDVHVNRIPVTGKVRAVRRRGTDFRAAFRREASARNVQTRIDIEAPGGARVGVAQITGLVARRIVTCPDEGDAVTRGEPYGLICYGSRVETYLPAAAEPRVAPGDRVKAGQTVIAELGR